MTPAPHHPIRIDALQFNNPTRARFEEWRYGGLDCVHVTVALWEDARETLGAIGRWNRVLTDNSDLIALARTATEIESIAATGRTAVVYGFQDASPFEDDIELVEIFHQLGVRIGQLSYNVQNRVAAGCWEDEDIGVSKCFGKNVIAEMNRLGMLVDVSHSTERSCFDAIEYSSRPIAITHANPQEFVGPDVEMTRRNKSTPLIRRLAETGGVIGLSMYPKIMRGGSAATLDDFLDMVAWTADLVGVDHVGIGSILFEGWPESMIKWCRNGRFSRESTIPVKGFSEWPTWFRSSADFGSIVEGMERRGFSSAEIAGVAGGNWLRLFADSFCPA